MQAYWTLTRRELAGFFLSLTGYVIIAAAAFLTGCSFILMTTPINDIEVVAAKFTASLVFYMAMWLPLLGCILVLRRFVGDSPALDLGVLGSTFLGIFLLGCPFLSFGCFASSLTRSQMSAAMISLVFSLGLFFLSFLPDRLPTADWKSQVVAFFSLRDQVQDFVRGVVDTRPVVLYLSLTFFFLFLTLRVLGSRRWK